MDTAPHDDSTVRIILKPKRPVAPPPAKRPAWIPVLIAGGLAIGAGVAGWALWPGSVSHDVVTAAPATVGSAGRAMPSGPVTEFVIQSATEDQILANVSTGISIFRFVLNPRILVLDFASLRDQGLMLNRVGAFAEKTGQPHDSVLTDAQLIKAIEAGGDTIETFYYGHDYSAATLVRFFALADRDQIRLNAHEEKLRRLLQQEGWFTPGMMAGLISIPRVGTEPLVTLDSRRTILHHELSHGEYFSNPDYVTYVRQFWRTVLTGRERDDIRKHLRSESYDTKIDELMENEMQAYLIFTDNPAFFAPSMINMSASRHAELRATFARGMPPGWLRDQAPRPLAVTPVRAITR